MLTDIFSYGVLILIVLIFALAYFWDNFKCKHDWEQHQYKSINKRNLNEVNKICLICKKCGKVKVLK